MTDGNIHDRQGYGGTRFDRIIRADGNRNQTGSRGHKGIKSKAVCNV
jgi:hypothetical protein